MDFELSTKVIPGIEPHPLQPGNSQKYFGEQSNDIQLNSVNDFALISGIDKLRQDINKILLTELGANTNFEIYGTTLQTLIGNKVNVEEIRAHLRDQVDTALAVLKFINEENTNNDEVPEIFESLSVEQLESGKYEVRVSVISKSGKRIVTDSIVLS